jgi:hypothetical protein
MESTTVTATMATQADSRKRYAFDHLLHRLCKFMHAYPRVMDDKMPDHDIVWMDEIERGGPAQTIRDAIKMHPEMWVEALPQECCIVHRETLKKYVGADAAEYMESHAANAVANQAARLLHEYEERERQRVYGGTIARRFDADLQNSDE